MPRRLPRHPSLITYAKAYQLIITRVSDQWAAVLNNGEITGYLSTRYVKPARKPTDTQDKPILLILGLLSFVFLFVVFGFRSKKNVGQKRTSASRA